jgi:hypothetical protein
MRIPNSSSQRGSMRLLPGHSRVSKDVASLWRKTKRNYFEGLMLASDHLLCVCIMSDQEQLQNRAARLLAMALKAREEGHFESAERFTKRASEILDQPCALERLGTQGGEGH